MKIRQITSLTASMAFILMLVTSLILFIVPQGRVAYWADWRLGGLTKTDWGNIHINLGLLFLIALFLHIYYNWKPLKSYLKNKSKKVIVRGLKKQGIEASEELTLKKIAMQNGINPSDLYERIKKIMRH